MLSRIRLENASSVSLQEVENNAKSLNFQAQKVDAVAYRRWLFTRSTSCKALALVFWIGQAVAYERWSHIEIWVYYFREILPVDAVLIMNSMIYLRNISHEYLLLLLLLTSRPPLPDLSPQVLFFFVSSKQDIHRTSSPTSLRHWICQKKNCRTSISGIGNYLDLKIKIKD